MCVYHYICMSILLVWNLKLKKLVHVDIFVRNKLEVDSYKKISVKYSGSYRQAEIFRLSPQNDNFQNGRLPWGWNQNFSYDTSP